MRMSRKYIEDTSGNVAMMFALVAVPLLICIGVAVDMSRISNYQTKLKDVADNTALTASLAYRTGGEKAMSEVGKEMFNSYAESIANLEYSTPVIKKTEENTVTVSAQGSFEPMFPQLFGYPKLDFSVLSEASLGSLQGMEITIAFDSTNSMSFDSRWDNAMTAMKSTLDNIQSLSGKDNFYISLVPFSDRVNIGQSNKKWTQRKTPDGWDGCVEPRVENVGAFKYMPDDTPVSKGRFTASIPGEFFKYSTWYKVNCPVVEITGPTNDVDKIIAATNSLKPGGTGRFDTGLAWAWRTLSPEWRGRWGVTNYPAHNKQGNGKKDHKNLRKKKILYVTDGNSHASFLEMDNESSWGHDQGSVANFESFVELCRNVKDSEIEIYMLNIKGNPHAMPYLEECASSPSHYYLVDDASEIKIAFADIERALSDELRLLR